VFIVLFRLNLLLGLFNLVPAPPLDGSSAIMIFMSDSTARRYLDWLRGGSFGVVGLLIAILIFRYAYPPIQDVVAQTLLAPQFF
jgi:Zn-dependent protease